MNQNNVGAALKYNADKLDELFGDDIPVQKVGFFSGIGRFFGRVFGRRNHVNRGMPIEAYSKFKQFYDELSKDDPSYMQVRQAATLCDDALRVAKQRLRVSARLGILDAQLADLDAFINLSDEEITDLKRMLERFVALASERSVLLEKLTDYDNSLVDMEPLAEDAKQAMPNIKDAEKHQRALRMDIGYLTGEKEELLFEREDMIKSLRLIQKFTLGMIGVFAVVTGGLVYMHFANTRDVFAPTAVAVLLIMAVVALLYFFRMRIKSELRLNTRKQQRAIELLNKKSVVYAYYTNFLRFCYKKYKAKSSRVLEGNLKDLEGYRFLANRIDTVRSIMYETETSIERFLREKKLGGMKATIEGFAKTVNLDDKRKKFNDLLGEKESMEKGLAEMDKRHEEIWDKLVMLNVDDPTQKVNAVLETYLTEAEKIFAINTEEEKVEERPIWKLFDMFADGMTSESLTATASEILDSIKDDEKQSA